jgi:hypothetical protein
MITSLIKFGDNTASDDDYHHADIRKRLHLLPLQASVFGEPTAEDKTSIAKLRFAAWGGGSPHWPTLKTTARASGRKLTGTSVAPGRK